MFKQKFRSALVASSLLLAVFLSVCAAQAQNLLSNPDFDAPANLDSWVANTGSALLGADSGSCATSGSADASSGLSGGGNQYFWMTSGQCIVVDPLATPQLHLAAMYRTSADIYSRLYLQYFSDANCGTSIGFSSTVVGATSPAWTRIAGPVAIDANAASIVVHADNLIAVSGGPAFAVQWDRFYLGVIPEIFLDDFEFESGSACHWSAVVGGI